MLDLHALAEALTTRVTCRVCERHDALKCPAGDWRAWCFRCAAFTGPVDLAQLHRCGLSWRDAAELVESMVPGLLERASIAIAGGPDPAELRLADEARERVIEHADVIPPHARRYLRARGLVANEGPIIYRYVRRGDQGFPDARGLAVALASGCYSESSDRPGHVHWTLGDDRILVGWRDHAGRVRGIASRRIDAPKLTEEEDRAGEAIVAALDVVAEQVVDVLPDVIDWGDDSPPTPVEPPKYLAPTRTAGLAQVWHCDARGPLVLVEGVLDAAIATQCGARVATTLGASLSADTIAALVELAREGDRVVLVPDADDAGTNWLAELAPAIVTAGAEVVVVELPAPHKDLADLLAEGSRPDCEPDVLVQQWRLVALLASARPAWQYLMARVASLTRDEGLIANLRELGVLDLVRADRDRQPARLAELLDAVGASPRSPTATRIRELLRESPRTKERAGSGLQIVRDEQGRLRNTYASVVAWLTAKLPNLRHDDMRGWIVDGDDRIDDRWVGDLRVRLEIEEGCELALDRAQQAVRHVALTRRYHPVRNWLATLRWDETDRIPALVDALRVRADARSVAELLVRRWLVSAVARVRHPGVQAHGVLVLHGPQGTRKSSAIRELAGTQWCGDTQLDLRTARDSYMQLSSTWIVELAEVDRLLTSGDSSLLKAIISSGTDSYRAPYAQAVEPHPRSSVCAGTSNKSDLLRDPTGDRRWWVLPIVERIDIDAIVAMRSQLWAQVAAMHAAGERHWLDAEEEERLRSSNAEFRVDPVGEWLDDCCEIVSDAKETPHKQLYDSYKAWCESHGNKPMTSSRLSSELDRRGFVGRRTAKGVLRAGVRLLAEDFGFDDAARHRAANDILALLD